MRSKMRAWSGSKKCAGASGTGSSSSTRLSISTAPRKAASASRLAGSARPASGRRSAGADRGGLGGHGARPMRPRRTRAARAAARTSAVDSGHSLWIVRGHDRSLPASCCICESSAPCPPDRIIQVTLDESTILWRNADIEQERAVAMRDLERGQHASRPLRAAERGHEGPWSLRLRSPTDALALALARPTRGPKPRRSVLGLAPLPPRRARLLRDLRFVLQGDRARPRRRRSRRSTWRAARSTTAARELLLDALDGKVETDFATARRLFTLICVLHIKA